MHTGGMGALVDRLQLADGDVGKNRDGLEFGVSDPAYAGLDEADIGAALQHKRGTYKAEKATGSAFAYAGSLHVAAHHLNQARSQEPASTPRLIPARTAAWATPRKVS